MALSSAACSGSRARDPDPVPDDAGPVPPAPDATTPDAGDPTLLPLLGSARGGHYWNDFCEGKPDSTVVPPDPRQMVVRGVNQDKAVYMNGVWQDCQTDDHPGTCGELRARVERGYRLVAANGNVGAGSLFAGSSAKTQLFSLSAEAYNRAYIAWGLDERPENFDELASNRWGTPLAPYGNPYPLPGEDPNETNGGSGTLPMALTQLREPDGTWTGTVSVTCNVCHGGQVGDADDGPGLGSLWGSNGLSDMTVMFADLGQVQPLLSSLAIFSLNKVRGTGNITNFQFFGMLEVTGHIAEAGPSVIAVQDEPSTGTEDPPVWWNLGHRVNKFYDGAQVVGSKRIELSFHLPGAPLHGVLPPGGKWDEDKQWILDNIQDSDAWITSLRSPAWPEERLGAIDVPLAEEGAVLFHTKDLWAEDLHNPIPPPDGGNGSCANCHGAYSPRYVHDPEFLDSPLLEGIAAYIVPLDVIGTDPRRLEGNNQEIVDASRNAWFAYYDGPFDDEGNPVCGNWNDSALRGDRELGYLAPPLYGVWATAPYFHNGSVPTIRHVLRSETRPTIWRRVSNAAPASSPNAVMGFATGLENYDPQTLGWNHDILTCGTSGVLNCNTPAPETIGDTLAGFLNTGLVWNLTNVPPYAPATIQDRKIYNTTRFAQSNSGHEFTDVLTEHEVLAILEYLKTL